MYEGIRLSGDQVVEIRLSGYQVDFDVSEVFFLMF